MIPRRYGFHLMTCFVSGRYFAKYKLNLNDVAGRGSSGLPLMFFSFSKYFELDLDEFKI